MQVHNTKPHVRSSVDPPTTIEAIPSQIDTDSTKIEMKMQHSELNHDLKVDNLEQL